MLDNNSTDIYSAYQSAKMRQKIDVNNHHKTKVDEAVVQTAEEIKKQNKLLLEQVKALEKQNKILEKMCADAKVDAEENKKQAKHNKIFGWVSLAVGTVIGIAGVLFGIFF